MVFLLAYVLLSVALAKKDYLLLKCNSAMVPEYWLTEGGQSATGALLEYIVENHVAAPLLANRAASQSK